MGKRILLFLLTNLAIMLVLSLILSLLGVGGYVSPEGRLQMVPLMIFCLVWGMGGAFLSLQMSRWIAKRSMGVHLIDGRTGNADLDWLYTTVGNLTAQANLPMPEVGVYDSAEVNAFATGPSKKRSLVAVSTGLLQSMEHREVEAVLGHEIGHIANGDMVTMTLLQGVINAFVLFFARLAAFAVRMMVHEKIAWVAGFVVRIALEIILGILGSLVTAWFSRQREFRADAEGARLAGRDSMVAVLRRLATTTDRIDTSKPALAAFKISDRKAWLTAFSTHPPLAERIAALESGR
ncbi:MAG TPA: protease HtpX [Thermoanaerobaculia bacterium]|jgi:heat shock protein HtpX|nr:protease HtpX [Thermoanaerobaculia bacterium]